MRHLIAFIFISLMPFISVYGQCKKKYVAGNMNIRQHEKSLGKPVKAATYSGIMFERPYLTGRYSFVRTEDDEFFFSFSYSRKLDFRKMDIFNGAPFIIYLADSTEIEVKSASTDEEYGLLAYYAITEEQIESIIPSYQIAVRFYFVSEKDIEGAESDSIGTYLEYEVRAKRFRTWFTNSAVCILEQ